MTTPRRRRVWHDTFISEAGTAGSFDEATLLEASAGDNKGRTLVRMIIDLHLQASAPTSSGTALMQIDVGIGMVSADVVAGSVLVGNATDFPISGWLWRRKVLVAENITSGGPLAVLPLYADIRSQRKLQYGEPRVFLAYTAQTGAAFAISTTGLIRQLYLLP